MSGYVVASGMSSSQLTIGSGSTLTVMFGGTAIATTITSAGVSFVSGLASDTVVSSRGTELVSSGGTTVSAILSTSGVEKLFGSATGLILRGGTANVSSGGVEIATIVSGGQDYVSAGGTAISTTVSGGFEEILSGGQATGTTVSAQGIDYVFFGGVASDITVAARGEADIGYGGTAVGTVVASGGSDKVYSSGVVSDSVVNSGGSELISRTATATGTIVSGGEQTVYGGGIAVNTTIAGGIMDLAGGAASNTIDFAAPGGLLDIDSASSVPAAVISGFMSGDAIDLTFVTYASGDSYGVGGDIVTISAGGSAYDLTIAGAEAGGFELGANMQGALSLTVCFFPGTGIRTAAGDVAVERLRIGDLLIAADGRALPLRWIGRNTVSTRFADPLRVLPIRIRRGALEDGLPARDLLLSPEHALLIEDILVQAGALVNGLSIIRERNVPEQFTYYHLELAEHVLLLAEGVPAESFVDYVGRRPFDNWAEHEALYGDTPIREMPYPRAQSQRQVPPGILAQLMRRAQTPPGEAAITAA